MDPSTKPYLGYQVSYPREDSVNNARKRKRESEEEEEPRKKSKETVKLSQGPSQQAYEDSNTVKTSSKRKYEDTEEHEHIKRMKLRPSQEDKSEDSSSIEKWPSAKRVEIRLTSSSSSSSCCSDDEDTVEDFSGDRQKSSRVVISNSSSEQEFEIERHRLSFSEEDEENSTTPLNTGKERLTSGPKRCACEGTSDGSVTALTSNDRNSRIVFEATYKQEKMIGQGVHGSVFAGYRKCDKLSVAIKHIPIKGITYTMVSQHGKEARIPLEVALMLRLKDVPAVVTLLDWYDLGSEVVLVLERPEHCVDLFDYVNSKCDLEEHSIKIIIQQLVDTFIEILSRGILHRAVHFKNILIELGSTDPRIRIIDFGRGSFLKSDENGETLTVLQIGNMLYNMLPASPFTSSDITEDCRDFVSACMMVFPEYRPSLRELQYHPWLIRLNPTNQDS